MNRVGLSSVVGLTLVSLLPGCTHGPAAPQAGNSIGAVGMLAGSYSYAATNQWMTIDEEKKSVQFRLISGVNNDKNYNGYTYGTMNAAVPDGWNVEVLYKNELGERHSAVIAPFAEEEQGQVHPVFIGSATPNAATGVLPGTQQRFQFKADKPGRYAIVCGVRGHRDRGMWATFIVSRDVRTPRIYIQHNG